MSAVSSSAVSSRQELLAKVTALSVSGSRHARRPRAIDNLPWPA